MQIIGTSVEVTGEECPELAQISMKLQTTIAAGTCTITPAAALALMSQLEAAFHKLGEGKRSGFAVEEKSDPPIAQRDADEQVGGEDEELVQKCLEVMRQENKASTSLFQRRLRLGYTRACRILDILEKRGYVSAGEGAQPRTILKT